MKTQLTIFVLLLAYAWGSIAQAERFPKFPIEKSMSVAVVAENIAYNGIPTRIYQFNTASSVSDVVEYYSKQWKDLNEVDSGDLKILSHRDGDYLLTVQIELNSRSAETHGTLTTSPMFALLEMSNSKLRKQKAQIGKDFPKLPNTYVVSDIKANEIVGESRSLLFSNEYDVERNMRFYRQKFSADGWQELITSAKSNSNLAGNSIALNKHGRKLNLSFSKQAGKTFGVAVFLP